MLAVDDSRPVQQAKKITLQQIADNFSVWPMKVSMIERGKSRDDGLTMKYREFLFSAV